MTIKIVVEVEGGVVQNIYSTDSNIEVTLIDWDNVQGGECDTLEENNYYVDTLTEQTLKEKLEEVNHIITENNEEPNDGLDHDLNDGYPPE